MPVSCTCTCGMPRISFSGTKFTPLSWAISRFAISRKRLW
ncbi:Uncharacterised protein [Vibrio cholerae]|nr:Uncharacterised protein [Vibrio cholerae]